MIALFPNSILNTIQVKAGVNILAKIPYFFPAFSLFLPRFLVLNNRKPLFLRRFRIFAYFFHPGGVAIGQNIFPWKSTNPFV